MVGIRIQRALALVAVTGVSLAAASVHAIPITGSFEGVVDGGFDLSGLFGTDGDLTGQALSGTFSYETDLAPAADGTGGFVTSGATNWLNASITINGVQYSFDTFASDPATHHELSVNLVDDPTGDALALSLARTLFEPLGFEAFAFTLWGGDFLADLNLPQTMTWPVGDGVGSGFFDVSCATTDAACSSPSFSGQFSISSVSIAPVSVPEPSTIGLLALGLAGALLGRTARRRKGDKADTSRFSG